MVDGAFGGSITITEIDQPFGLPGIKFTNMHFSLVWLAEAMEPVSMSASAGVTLIERGADEIDAR